MVLGIFIQMEKLLMLTLLTISLAKAHGNPTLMYSFMILNQ